MTCCGSIVLLWNLLLSMSITGVHNECTPIEIVHPVIDSVWTVEENTTLNITFTIKNNTCTHTNDLLIQVNAKHYASNRSDIYCIIRQRNYTCIVSTYRNVTCVCLLGNKLYSFTKTLQRTDNTFWRFSILNEYATDTVIYLNVTYSAKLINITINGNEYLLPHIVGQREQVEVACTWENGNPPTTIHMFHNQDKTLMSSSNGGIGNMTFYLSNSTCQDAGVIMCKADGLNEILSVTLLIKCPPTFDNRLQTKSANINTGYFVVNFTFHAHTANIKACELRQTNERLGRENVSTSPGNHNQHSAISNRNTSALCGTKYTDTISDHNLKINCFCNVSGTEPDLILSLFLSDVSLDNESVRWILTLYNEEGVGHADLLLHTTDDKLYQHVNLPSNDEIYKGDNWTFFIWGSAAGVLFTFIIATGVCAASTKQTIVESGIPCSSEKDVRMIQNNSLTEMQANTLGAVEQDKVEEFGTAVTNGIYERGKIITLPIVDEYIAEKIGWFQQTNI